jgi:lipid A ethanolaminephosphotransferase
MTILQRWHARWPWRPLSQEMLVLGVAALITLLGNGAFWQGALAGRSFAEANTWRFVLGAGVMITAVQGLLLLLLAHRHTVRPVLALALVSTAVGGHMMARYGVVLDPSMLRNAMRTDVREATELFNPGLLLSIVGALVASALLWVVPLRVRPWRRAALVRGLTMLGTLVVAVAALLLIFQDFGSLMRNHKALRYTLTPVNVFYSTTSVVVTDMRAAARKPEPPQPVERLAQAPGRKPAVFVVVLGETARAANFGLGGYRRDTTPELRRQTDAVYFPQTMACGTSTEVSVPCMFSAFGRADYDEDRIRASESVLTLMARAGLRVVWLDNQSGCKGVCQGTDTRDVSHEKDPTLCDGERCFDEILVKGLERVLAEPDPQQRDTVVVLHQLGNHGPAYYRRYPAAFRRFTPECQRNELRECSQAEIVNAYDNALLYTDWVVNQTIEVLKRQRPQREVGLVYVSDHGESLGEGGLYLHGMPQAIAPDVQLHVPMLWWFGRDESNGRSDMGVDSACLRQRASAPASHDHLFHTLLRLMAVDTPRYQAGRDLLSACRDGTAPAK